MRQTGRWARRGTHTAPAIAPRRTAFAGRRYLPELIAPTLDDYERTAIDLANDPERLEVIRDRLARARTLAPLFDSARFVRNLERAYQSTEKPTENVRAIPPLPEGREGGGSKTAPRGESEWLL